MPPKTYAPNPRLRYTALEWSGRNLDAVLEFTDREVEYKDGKLYLTKENCKTHVPKMSHILLDHRVDRFSVVHPSDFDELFREEEELEPTVTMSITLEEQEPDG